MEKLQTALIIWFTLMNAAGLAVMGIDKYRAAHGKSRRRIPEKTLFGVSLLGGSLGTLVGMYAFRHKTKHWYFVVGMPLILAAHAALIYLLIVR